MGRLLAELPCGPSCRAPGAGAAILGPVLAILVTGVTLAAVCLVLGRGIAALAGGGIWVRLAPVTGFAALMVIATVIIRLPGHAATSRAVVGLAVLGALVVARRSRTPWAGGAAAVPVALAALLLALVPFATNGRTGILGVTDNADFSVHLLLADTLLTGASDQTPLYNEGYPIGPHAIAATATGFGTDVLTAFNALFLLVPVLTALAAAAVLRELTLGRRMVAAALTALPYLPAAYLIQASFKEPMQAFLVLGFALGVGALAKHGWKPYRAAGPLGLLATACIFTYGYAGVVWPIAIVGAWAGLELVLARRLPSPRLALAAIRPAAVAGGVLLLTLLPDFSRLLSYLDNTAQVETGATTGGNIATELPGYQILGVWLSRDFRVPPNVFYAGMLSGVALAVALYAASWWLRRRSAAVPAAAAVSVLIFVGVRYQATPYYETKALVIAAPLITLMATRAILAALPKRGELLSRLRSGTEAQVKVAFAAIFIVGLLVSSLATLTNARVSSRDHAEQLASIRPMVKGRPTLFLGQDDYAFWELRGARVATFISYIGKSEVPFSLRVGKGNAGGAMVDFDSLDRGNLDRFDYIVSPRSSYASVPTLNWQVAKTTESYTVWRRTGPTPDRDVFEPVGKPGALFNCRRPLLRRLSRRNGEAVVGAAPVVGPSQGWVPSFGPPSFGLDGFLNLETGGTATQRLRLGPGLWDISIQYLSPTRVTVEAGGLSATLPPNEERTGPFWSAGRVRSEGGRVNISVKADPASIIAGPRAALLGAVAATRVDVPERTVPLEDACGGYVTSYRLAQDGT